MAYGGTNKGHLSQNDEVRDVLGKHDDRVETQGLRHLPCKWGEVEGVPRQRNHCGKNMEH